MLAAGDETPKLEDGVFQFQVRHARGCVCGRAITRLAGVHVWSQSENSAYYDDSCVALMPLQ